LKQAVFAGLSSTRARSTPAGGVYRGSEARFKATLILGPGKPTGYEKNICRQARQQTAVRGIRLVHAFCGRLVLAVSTRIRQTFGLAFRLMAMRRYLVVCLLAAFGALAQPAPMAFEVASIKPSTSGAGRSNDVINDGGIVLTNVTLRQCVEAAYDIQDPELVGPDWLETTRFDIQAKPPAVHPKEYLQPMLKTLLEDRFKLSTHREMRTIPAYALVIGKDGLKIKEVEPGEGKTKTSG
jgi:hypothetical protein